MDSEPEPEHRGWLDRWRPKKNFENLKIRVESWAEDLSDIDLTEMERIYLDPNFYQLLPFRSNRTYTKEVMDKFLQSGSQYEPISERTRSKTFNGYPRINEFYEASNRTASSSSGTREVVITEEAISIEEAAGIEKAAGTEEAVETEEVEGAEETTNIEDATSTKEVARSHPRTEKTTSNKVASTSYRQNVRFEQQTQQESSNDSGVFSRLRSRLVDSLESSSNSSKSSNSWTSSLSDLNRQTNGNSSTNSNSSGYSSLNGNNSKNNSSKTNGSPRRNLTLKEGTNQAIDSNQRTRSVDKALANREVSLIKHRLVKKKLWLNEQAMLSDMNANYLSDLNGLNDFSDCDDYEKGNEKGNKKSNRSDGPVASVLRSIRRTSNRVKNSTSNTPVTTARTINTSRPRRPAKRKAKENLRQSPDNLKVTFASDSLLDFSDLDEIDAEPDLKESTHELHPLKAPTRQLYLFVALVFLSIFTFKFINSQ